MGPTYIDIVAHNRIFFGERTAITIDDRGITHAQLAELVERTRALLAAHVREGDRIALWLPNSFAWVASFLATRALGATLVPVNTRLTPAELSYILEDSRAAALIATSDYRERDYVAEALGCGASCPVVVDANDDLAPERWRIIGKRKGTAKEKTPRELMFIQYTSGTTSAPKGVMLTEEAYLRTAAHCGRVQQLTPLSQFMSATPMFHCSGSMHALSTCLVAGCTLHTMSAWDVEKFLHLAGTYRGDRGHGIFMRDVLSYGTERARPFLRTMKVLAATGPRADLMAIHDDLGITGVGNLFGMTETCGNLTMWYPDDPLEARVSGNGRPQPGNRIRIVSPDTGEQMAPGEVGEIQVQGSTVTAGYFNRPELTEAAFTADGWLRTGDLGSMTPEAGLVYRARRKELIRVGGENLAPAEIEQVFREITGLDELCVVAEAHERLGEVPVIVAVRDETIDWHAVLAQARTRLAGFKMPRAVYAVDAFAKTVTNRIQKASVQRDVAAGKLKRLA